MDPSMNHRQSQVHAADLYRRAELHRLAAESLATRREVTFAKPQLVAPPNPLATVEAFIGRIGRRIRHPVAATHSRPT